MPDDTAIPEVRIPDLPSPLDVCPPMASKGLDATPGAGQRQDPLGVAVRERLVQATHDRWQAIGAAQQRKLNHINALQVLMAGGRPAVPPAEDPR